MVKIENQSRYFDRRKRFDRFRYFVNYLLVLRFAGLLILVIIYLFRSF